jgi:hypothetical protein
VLAVPSARPTSVALVLVLALVAAALVLCTAPGRARADVSQARIAIAGGLRLNFGDVGKDFAWGWQIIDVEAALQPFSFFRSNLRTGPCWWTTVSRISATSASALDARLSTLQMGLGWRVAGALPLYGYPISVHAQAGYELLRASRPVPPDNQGTYFGPAVQAGLEYGNGASFWGVQATWDPIGTGPEGVYVLVFVGLGQP